MGRLSARYPVLSAMREAAGLGLSAIAAYKMRAGLTILGVVMGIMTVTGMSSIVAGLNANMAAQIQSLGSAVIFVRPFMPGTRRTDEEIRRARGLSVEEIRTLTGLPLVRAVAPLELQRVDLIKYGSLRTQDAQVIGTTPEYETVHELYVERGRFLTQADVDRGTKVVVIGADVVDALFPHVDPIDKEMSLDGRPYRVVGVLERKGKLLFRSRDNLLFVPLGAGRRDPNINFLLADLQAVSPDRLQGAVDQVSDTLRRKRRLRYLARDNFGVFTQDAIADLYNQVTGGIYLVMIAISSIGLVVGGVGVMNIMLVSVTERTREIGVRKALGARKRDILWQFLTEAMTLTGAGGIIGILLGGAVAFLLDRFSPFPAVVQPAWVLIALGTSLGVGLFFGLWPAAKAARLDPIEALRYE